MKTKLHIVKIGGEIINNKSLLNQFIIDFSHLPFPKILVHGGGKLLTEFSKKLGIDSKFIDGRRITSEKDLELAVMFYAGLINKSLCAKLHAKNQNPIGLTGVDGNLMQSKKRKPKPVNFGLVGDISKVNISLLELLLRNKFVPVIAAITHDGNGQLLNTNADSVAAEIAIHLSQSIDTVLYYCFDQKGVLKNISDPNTVIEELNQNLYEELKKEGKIKNGMIAKLDNCFYALKKNVPTIIVGGSRLFNDNNLPHTKIIH